MVVRLVIAVALIALAWVVGRRLDKRVGRSAPLPVRDRAQVPTQLDRDDFPRPEAEWLLVLFSSAECGGCAEMSKKVALVECDEVAVADVDYATQRELQEKYSVDAVPMMVVADAEGAVRAHALGNVPSGDVWAAVARARDGGSRRPGASDVGPVGKER